MDESLEPTILEKTENNFTVHFNGKYYGYFTSYEGAKAYSDVLKELDKSEKEDLKKQVELFSREEK